MRLIGRGLRIFLLGVATLLGSLSAVSVTNYARYGRVFRKTTGSAAAFMMLFFGAALAVWRFGGGKRQFDTDRSAGV